MPVHVPQPQLGRNFAPSVQRTRRLSGDMLADRAARMDRLPSMQTPPPPSAAESNNVRPRPLRAPSAPRSLLLGILDVHNVGN
eukprot:632229-Prorocentrum_minimum.AAC.1